MHVKALMTAQDHIWGRILVIKPLRQFSFNLILSAIPCMYVAEWAADNGLYMGVGNLMPSAKLL